ncbi:MAG: hypothetical protein H0X34_16135 [Chthoniobacterales bacterium]|jgi:hypothetical protein|nr:hypothetical protein [Chthoniobacterales bacterium]
MKSSVVLAGLAFLAGIFFSPIPRLSAQVPSGVDPQLMGQSGDGPVVVIGFANGSSIIATAERGLSGVVGLQAHQTVSLQLSFPANFAGQPIVAESLDGGILRANQPAATVNSDGSVNLTFEGGALPGLNRVALHAGGNISVLRFWVIDPRNSTTHPPLLSSTR